MSYLSYLDHRLSFGVGPLIVRVSDGLMRIVVRASVGPYVFFTPEALAVSGELSYVPPAGARDDHDGMVKVISACRSFLETPSVTIERVEVGGLNVLPRPVPAADYWEAWLRLEPVELDPLAELHLYVRAQQDCIFACTLFGAFVDTQNAEGAARHRRAQKTVH